jgi:CspA family cold shock protein
MAAQIFKGKIKFYLENKGYGFISEDSGNEYFVHASNCIDKLLKKDDLVTFELEDGKKGQKAINVKRLK